MPGEATTQPENESRVENPRYTMKVEGSRWGIATYGIVEFLRVHRAWRVVIAILGIGCGLAFIGAFLGLRIPGSKDGPYVVLFILTPWLLWLATISGPSFQLVFPAEQAAKERQVAEQTFEKSQAPEDALQL